MKLSKLLGGKPNAPVQIMSLVIGEDRTIARPLVDAAGVQFLNMDYKLGYDALPQAVGSFYLVHNGQKRYLGQGVVLYEPMARPWSLESLQWVPTDKINKTEVVLSTARSEASSIAVNSIVKEDRFDRLSTALILAICLFGIMVLLFILQSGVLKSIFK